MKIRKLLTLLIISLFGLQSSYSQGYPLSSQAGETSFGIGLGLPYGGLGMRLGTNISTGLNLFGGIGYQLVGVGYNVGLLKDFETTSSTQFYLVGMYGTNAAIKIEGLSSADDTFSGPTFGLGVKVNSRQTEGNFWDIGLLVPIRSSEFKDAEASLKNNPFISDFTDAWPVLLTIGYNFNI